MDTATRENPLALVFAVMEEQGRTQTWLARQLGVQRSMVTHYKVGRRHPSEDQVRRAHELLGLPQPHGYAALDKVAA